MGSRRWNRSSLGAFYHRHGDGAPPILRHRRRLPRHESRCLLAQRAQRPPSAIRSRVFHGVGRGHRAFCNPMNHRLSILALAAILIAAPASAAHLLISEVGYDPLDETGATAEFVEILNPGPGAVSLANFWLADDEEAYPLIVNGPVASGITLQDFVY